MYSLETEASRLAEKAVNLIRSSLPWLDDPARAQLCATFTREYGRMLEQSTRSCLNCGSTNVVEDTVESPTGVLGETWTESGYVCRSCRSFDSSVAVVIPLDAIEMQPPLSPIRIDNVLLDDHYVFGGLGVETGSAHTNDWSTLHQPKRHLREAAQEGVEQ